MFLCIIDSLIGKSTCSVLCKSEYIPLIAEIINNSKSDAKVLEGFDRLNPGVFKPELLQAGALNLLRIPN